MMDILSSSIKGRQNSGRVNEDAKLVDSSKGIFIVADGMGGYERADEASKRVVSTVYRESLGLVSELARGFPENEIEPLLADIASAAHQELQAINISVQLENSSLPLSYDAIVNPLKVLQKIKKLYDEKNSNTYTHSSISDILQQFPGLEESLSLSGERKTTKVLGSTLDAVVFHKDIAYFVHVGDSSITRFSNYEWEKLTSDHVKGSVSYADSRFNTLASRNFVLSSYLGMDGQLTTQTGSVPLRQGQVLFMATDGVTNTVSPSEIRRAFTMPNTHQELKEKIQKPDAMANAYVQLARISAAKKVSVSQVQKDLGGADNATYIAIRRI